MSVDKDFAIKQLKRFTSFPGVPQTVPELEERAGYLAGLASDNRQCEEIVDRMMRSVRYFPLPVDMEIAAEKAVPKAWNPELPPCGCGGTGWLSKDEQGIAYATRCKCVAGAEKQIGAAR